MEIIYSTVIPNISITSVDLQISESQLLLYAYTKHTRREAIYGGNGTRPKHTSSPDMYDEIIRGISALVKCWAQTERDPSMGTREHGNIRDPKCDVEPHCVCAVCVCVRVWAQHPSTLALRVTRIEQKSQFASTMFVYKQSISENHFRKIFCFFIFSLRHRRRRRRIVSLASISFFKILSSTSPLPCVPVRIHVPFSSCVQFLGGVCVCVAGIGICLATHCSSVPCALCVHRQVSADLILDGVAVEAKRPCLRWKQA